MGEGIERSRERPEEHGCQEERPARTSVVEHPQWSVQHQAHKAVCREQEPHIGQDDTRCRGLRR